MEVEVRGRQLRVFFDGALVNETTRPAPVPKGSIGIGLSGNSHMLIRSMSIKRLEPVEK